VLIVVVAMAVPAVGQGVEVKGGDTVEADANKGQGKAQIPVRDGLHKKSYPGAAEDFVL
jgi:hypothetical protein